MTETTDSPLNPPIPFKVPPESILTYLTDYFTSHPEKHKLILSFLVLNALPELTASKIRDLKKQGLSYSEISTKFGYNLSKGTIHKIEKQGFFPKTDKKRLELLKKVLELI